MKLTVTDTNRKELFTANVLLPEASVYADGTARIEIDALDRQPDAQGKYGAVTAEALFELHGTKDELKEFLEVMLAALDEAQTIPSPKKVE